MKLQYLCAVLFSLVMVVGCSDDDSGNGGGNNSPISGKSFGVDFTLAGGYAEDVTFTSTYVVSISTQALGCTAPESSIVAEIYCPNSVGVHTSTAIVTFFDSEGNFQSIGTNNRVEITSNSDGRLKGKVNVPGLPSFNMSGTFDLPFCD